MTFSSPSSRLLTTVLVLLLIIISSPPATSCYTSMFNFGDSISDTGNELLSPEFQYVCSGHSPYGETFFHSPTGRFSDGRIIIDFIGLFFFFFFYFCCHELPLVPPYLGGQNDGIDFRRGVNFAIGSATALNDEVFVEMGLPVTWTSSSLSAQVRAFEQLLPSLCSPGPDCYSFLSKSLIQVEIGGNDYNVQFHLGRKLEEIQASVPHVVHAISSAINDLVGLGARTLMVSGEFPLGCIPGYLTQFQSTREEDYDPHTGCIKWLNEFAEYHNSQLLQELDRIRHHYPYATIIYTDYFNSIMDIMRAPRLYGFKERPLSACCGAGGPYNYDESLKCGYPGATVCDDPSRYVSWDGLHYTEAAYKFIAEGILNGPFSIPRFDYQCPNMEGTADHTLLQSMQ